jgi:D-sedoheptulose 7-phosphate isomerase
MSTEDKEFIDTFFNDAIHIMYQIDRDDVQKVINIIRKVRDTGGRLFILGVGGGAAHASHAVNDFRKLCGIEAYAPTDNVSELTARTNDEGWDTTFEEYLKTSRLTANDCVMIISVGGGNLEHNVSMNIVKALKYATKTRALIVGIVGRDGGETAKYADACVIIPTQPVHSVNMITPQTESMQALVWHMIVSSPSLKRGQTKW